ncbi:MAG: hypothetical protein KTR31_12035 [Myxococcales bacterium]|nr:hypothetical protein [Myxococcales bacterium]
MRTYPWTILVALLPFGACDACDDDGVFGGSPPSKYVDFDCEGGDFCLLRSDVKDNPGLEHAVCEDLCFKTETATDSCTSTHASKKLFSSTFCDPYPWKDRELQIPSPSYACTFDGAAATLVETVDEQGQPTSHTELFPIEDWAAPGTWQVCAPGPKSAEATCESRCTALVTDLVDQHGEALRFFTPGGSTVLDADQTIAYTEIFVTDPEAFCDDTVLKASGTDQYDCPASPVGDPTMILQWPGGSSLPLDCDLNEDCCVSLGVCDELFAQVEGSRPESRTEVSLTGTLTIDHPLGSTQGEVSGVARFTADGCSNRAGSCPMYLGALSLHVERMSEEILGVTYTLVDVNADLQAPVMGAWQPDTGEIWIPADAVPLELRTTNLSASDGSVDERFELQERTDDGLVGSFVDGVLTLSATRAVEGSTLRLNVSSR